MLSILIVKSTRVVYINDYSSNIPSISDADYLDIYDLRMLSLLQDKDIENQLKLLTQNMIQESYISKGVSDVFKENVDAAVFKRLNPNYSGETNYQLIGINVECLVYGDKAIVYWSKLCCYDKSNNVINCVLNTQTLPYHRLYFKKDNSIWKVVDFMQPA